VRGIEHLEQRCLLSTVQIVGGVVEINANNGTATNTVVLNQDKTNPALVDVFVDNTTSTPDMTFNPTTDNQVQVSTTVPAGVQTDNQLELNLGTYSSETYSATAAGAGTIVGQGGPGGVSSLKITYTGIDAVFDDTIATTGSFTDGIASDTLLTLGNGTSTTPVDGAINYVSIRGTEELPPVGRQLPQALVEVDNKTNLTIDAGTDAHVVLNSTVQPDREQQQTIKTEAPDGTVTVLATGLNGVNTTISTTAQVSNTVNVGMPGSQLFQVELTLTNVAGSSTAVVADESAETELTNINLSDTDLSFQTPPTVTIPGEGSFAFTYANINYAMAIVPSLTINGSGGGNNVTVTTTNSQTATVLNPGDGTNTVTIDDAPGSLVVNTGTGKNTVDVDLTKANTYNLSVHGSGPAQDNTLDISDVSRGVVLTAPELMLTATPTGTDSGAVTVQYLLGYSINELTHRLVATYKTYSIPYTDIPNDPANLMLLPDAEHSLVQALYQDILEQTATLAQLTPEVTLLQKTGKIQSVVTKLEDSPAGRKLAKGRPKIVLNQLPDFALVQAELKASKPTKKPH